MTEIEVLDENKVRLTSGNGHIVEVALFPSGAGWVSFEVEGRRSRTSYPWPWETVDIPEAEPEDWCRGCGAPESTCICGMVNEVVNQQ